MGQRSTARTAAFLFAAGWAAVAMGADDFASPAVSVYSGGELDDDSGTRIDLGFSLSTAGGTTWSLSGSRADVDSVAGKLVSTAGSGIVDHSFGRFGVAGGLRHVREEDYSKSLTWIAEAYVDFDVSRVAMNVERRDIDMDQTEFTVAGADVGLPAFASATGDATCELTSTGYGLSGMFAATRWSLYGSAMQYDYSGYDCMSTVTLLTMFNGTEIPVAPGSQPPIAVRRPVLFERITRNLTRAFDGVTASRIPRENALLESSMMLGFETYATSRITLGAEAYRDTDEFAADDTLTLLAYLEWRATEVISLTTTLGTSDSDSVGRLQFVGLRVTARFGD